MNELSMVRGDTLELSIDNIIDQNGEKYRLLDTDKLYLDVKKDPKSKEPVFRKIITAEDYLDEALIVVIFPDDTVNLNIGTYYFDVRLVVDERHIYTIVPMTRLNIIQNVTGIPDNGGGG